MSQSMDTVWGAAVAVAVAVNIADRPRNRAAADRTILRMADMAKPPWLFSVFLLAGIPLENNSTTARLQLIFDQINDCCRRPIANR